MKSGWQPTKRGEPMDTERTRRIVELINQLDSEQMESLERFLRELLRTGDEKNDR